MKIKRRTTKVPLWPLVDFASGATEHVQIGCQSQDGQGNELKTAKAMNYKISAGRLLRADKIIE